MMLSKKDFIVSDMCLGRNKAAHKKCNLKGCGCDCHLEKIKGEKIMAEQFVIKAGEGWYSKQNGTDNEVFTWKRKNAKQYPNREAGEEERERLILKGFKFLEVVPAKKITKKEKKDFAFAPIYTRDEVLQTLQNAMKQSGDYVTIHKKVMAHLIESITKIK